MLLELSVGDNTSAITGFLAEHAGKPNIVIQGKGAGLSYCYAPIRITGERPTIRGLTIETEGTCLSLENPFESLVEDVWVITKLGGLGIFCGIKESMNPAPTEIGTYYKPWRGYEDGTVRRSYFSMFRDVFVYGDGDGWKIGADFDWRAGLEVDLVSGFSNHMRIHGGATYVKGTGMEWSYLYSCVIFGHHMDAHPSKGVNITGKSRYNQWIGGWIEPNSVAKKDKIPVVIGDLTGGDIFPVPPPGGDNQWTAITTGDYF